MLRLLDLFCGGGGGTHGYQQAGFHVTGVDMKPQPRYVGNAFVQADALEYLADHGQEYAVIHASPPCQAYSVLKHLTTRDHPRLIEAVRAALQATQRPYVIENVVGAPLHFPLLLCGSMFHLATPCGAQLRRHRLFESNLLLMAPGDCQHAVDTIGVHGHEFRNEATRYAERTGETICLAGDHPHSAARRKHNQRTIMVVGATARDPALERTKCKTITVTGSTPQQNVERNRLRETFTIKDAQIAMGIDWMPMRELSQAIPPAYTYWIGHQLIHRLTAQHEEV